MRGHTADIFRGRAREAAYMLALTTAITTLWVYAWALSLTAHSNYVGCEPIPSGIANATPQSVATVDDNP